jgi:hypothetical protein
MMKPGRVALAEVARRPVHAGRAAGFADRAKIERAVAAAAADGKVVLDCSGLAVLSASYFDAALWPLWSASPELYPLLAKPPQDAIDDITVLLRANGGVILFTEKNAKPQMLGTLDPTLKRTLELVVEKGAVTAGDLLDVDGNIGATGWSNRLAALHELRLVQRRKDGRRLIYSPAWEVVNHG